ncbi:MAG: ribosome maturation factor RimM [Nitrospirota bacterium]
MRPGDTGIEARVLVGIVLKTIGLKGELKIKPLTDNPDRYSEGAKVWAEVEGGKPPLPLTVRSSRAAGRDIAVYFDEIGSIEEAEGFRGKELFVPESDVPPLPEGEYYQYQVLGLEVYASSGRLLGKVSDIIEAGEKDVYVVRGGGKEYLIPVTDEAVEEIDVKGGKIKLRPMKGYIPE